MAKKHKPKVKVHVEKAIPHQPVNSEEKLEKESMSNEKLRNLTTKHLVEIITPVHVGTGEELSEDFDFVVESGEVSVPDQEYLLSEIGKMLPSGKISQFDLEQLSSLTGLMLKFSELERKLKENKKFKNEDFEKIKNYKERYSYKLMSFGKALNEKGTEKKKEEAKKGNKEDFFHLKIREHIKDGFLYPIIPGSSLKGAMRTALLVKLIEEQGLKVLNCFLPERGNNGDPIPEKEQDADNKLVEYLFSPSFESGYGDGLTYHNFDLLRTLHVSDMKFETKALKLVDMRRLNLVREDKQLKAKWKVMGKDKENNQPKPSTDKWEEATKTLVEALVPIEEDETTTSAALTLQIDNFLLKNRQAQKVLQWDNNPNFNLFRWVPKNFEEWCDVLNKHAKKRLEREIQFFKDAGVTDNEAMKQYQSELEEIKGKIESEIHCNQHNAAYVRVAWGNGWCGMTGDWMDYEIKNEMMELYNLGKSDASVFPKTRGLIVKGEQPYVPFGWIRILSEDKSKKHLEEIEREKAQQEEQLRQDALIVEEFERKREQERDKEEQHQREIQQQREEKLLQDRIKKGKREKLSEVQKVLYDVREVLNIGDKSKNSDLSRELTNAIGQALADKPERWSQKDCDELIKLTKDINRFQKPPSRTKERREALLEQLKEKHN